MSGQKKWIRAALHRRAYCVLLLLLQAGLMAYAVICRSRTTAWIKIALFAVSFGTALRVLAGRGTGAFRLSWVFIILTFPLLGGPLYLLFRFQTRSKRLQKRVMQMEAQTHSEKAEDERLTELEERQPEWARLARYLSSHGGAPLSGNTKAEFFSPAEAGYGAMLSALKQAEKCIFLEYFIIERGKMWDGMLAILKEKAAKGVDVRILYDDIGCFLRLPKGYAESLAAFGIKCRVFRPLRPFFTALQNSRDHRKILAVDGRIAFTGGFNLADEYINEIHPYGQFKDAGVCLLGDGAWRLALFFLQMWMFVSGEKEDIAFFAPPPSTIKGKGFVQPYADTPYGENISKHIYLQMINGARRYLYMATPYFIPDDEMLSALMLAAKGGVDVRLLLPHHYDKAFVRFTTRSFLRELIRSGVRVYEYTAGFVHAKTFVSDGTAATVGTANLDFRSLYLQFECGVCLYGCEAVRAVEKDFLETFPLCLEITERDCKNTALTRFLQDVLRLFAPLM